jgi:hypothetical protein
MASWAYYNPGYSLMLFDDADIRAFMTTYYPDLLATFDGLGTPVERADLWRYLVLCRLGGVYADSDVMAARPISQWAQDAGLLVGIENVFTTPEEARRRSYSRQVRGGAGCSRAVAGCGTWRSLGVVWQAACSAGQQFPGSLRCCRSACMLAAATEAVSSPQALGHSTCLSVCLPAAVNALLVGLRAGPDGAVVDRVSSGAPRGVPHGAVRGQARGGGAGRRVPGP